MKKAILLLGLIITALLLWWGASEHGANPISRMNEHPEFNLCDKELVSNPSDHTWLEYFNVAMDYAENETTKDDALFCFLLSKIKVAYATHVGEGGVDGDIDQRALLNTIVPAEGRFYSLFSNEPERGIEIIDEARRWLEVYAPVLAGSKNDGTQAYQAAENDLLYTRNEYQLVVDQRAGKKFDLDELENMGITVPEHLVVKRQSSYTSAADPFFFLSDLNGDGVRDVVYLAQDTRNDTWQVVIEMSEGSGWRSHSMALPAVDEYFDPSIQLEGDAIIARYTMHVDESSTAAVGGGFMGNVTPIRLRSVFHETPILVQVTAEFKKGNFGYEQAIDLQRGVYTRRWTSESGGAMAEETSEKLPYLEKSVAVEPIPWSSFTPEVLQEVLNVTESN